MKERLLSILLGWIRRGCQNSGPLRGTLVIQPLPGIGDMVWHLPHLHALAQIEGPLTILTKDRSQAAELLRADPSVARVISLQRPGRHAGLIGLLRLAWELRQERYASAWLFHGSSRYAWALVLAGIPKTAGYGRGWQRYLLTSTCLPPERLADHPIAKADLLLQRAGIPVPKEIPILYVEPKLKQQIQQEFGALAQPWIALGIGSSEAYKQWGAQNFSALACALRQRYHAEIFLLGGPAEQAMATAIVKQVSRSIGYAPIYRRQSIARAAAVLSHCVLFIGNDTGTLNIAAALNIPALGLFGASQALSHLPSIVPIRPAPGQRGIAAISHAQVLALAEQHMPHHQNN